MACLCSVHGPSSSYSSSSSPSSFPHSSHSPPHPNVYCTACALSSLSPLHSKIASLEQTLASIRSTLPSPPTTPTLPNLSATLTTLRQQLIMKRKRNTNLSHALLTEQSQHDSPHSPHLDLSTSISSLNTLHATLLPNLHLFTRTLHTSLLSLLHTRISLHLASYQLTVSPYRAILGLPFTTAPSHPLTFLTFTHLATALSSLDPIIEFPIAEKLTITATTLLITGPDSTSTPLLTPSGLDLLGFYIMLICTQAGLVDLGDARDYVGNLWRLQGFCERRIQGQ